MLLTAMSLPALIESSLRETDGKLPVNVTVTVLPGIPVAGVIALSIGCAGITVNVPVANPPKCSRGFDRGHKWQ
jgi:hypothetical protein